MKKAQMRVDRKVCLVRHTTPCPPLHLIKCASAHISYACKTWDMKYLLVLQLKSKWQKMCRKGA